MSEKNEGEIEISTPVISGLVMLVILVFVIIGWNLYRQKCQTATTPTVTLVAPEAKKVLVPVEKKEVKDSAPVTIAIVENKESKEVKVNQETEKSLNRFGLTMSNSVRIVVKK